MREGTTSRVTAADRTYSKFYDFYSASPENSGSTHVYLCCSWARNMTRANRRNSCRSVRLTPNCAEYGFEEDIRQQRIRALVLVLHRICAQCGRETSLATKIKFGDLHSTYRPTSLILARNSTRSKRRN